MIFLPETARWIAGAGVAISLLGVVADRRRMRRRDPDAVGWMPWRGFSIAAFLVAMVFAVVAIQGWVRG